MSFQSFDINGLVYWTQTKSTLLITFHLSDALLDYISCRLSTRLNLSSACTAAHKIYQTEIKTLLGLHMAGKNMFLLAKIHLKHML